MSDESDRSAAGPATGSFSLRNSLSARPASYSFRFGPRHMIPLTGDWDGQ